MPKSLHLRWLPTAAILTITTLPAPARKMPKPIVRPEKGRPLQYSLHSPYLASGDVDTPLVATAASYCESARRVAGGSPTPGLIKTPRKAASQLLALEQEPALFFRGLNSPTPTREPNRRICSLRLGGWNFFPYRYSTRGVESSAGLEATLVGVPQLSVPLTDPENGELNPLGINCLRDACAGAWCGSPYFAGR